MPCVASGVRICGGGCPSLDSTQCPGGCQPVSTVDGAHSDIGVCWSDLAKAGVSCAVCNDGEACLQRSPGALVCVPEDLCAHIWDLGAQNVCRYADKSTFDDRPLPTPGACPSAATAIICGGGCPACPVNGEHRCVGRSPDHPFGICPPAISGMDPNEPTSVSTCSLSAGNYAVPCPQLSTGPFACAVFHAGASDQAAAMLYGLCVGSDLCAATARALPGGLDCYNPAGRLMSP